MFSSYSFLLWHVVDLHEDNPNDQCCEPLRPGHPAISPTQSKKKGVGHHSYPPAHGSLLPCKLDSGSLRYKSNLSVANCPASLTSLRHTLPMRCFWARHPQKICLIRRLVKKKSFQNHPLDRLQFWAFLRGNVSCALIEIVLMKSIQSSKSRCSFLTYVCRSGSNIHVFVVQEMEDLSLLFRSQCFLC